MADKRKATEFEKDVFVFLNDLRESGETNMFGATPYIVSEFSINVKEARDLLTTWMHNFSPTGDYEEIEA